MNERTGLPYLRSMVRVAVMVAEQLRHPTAPKLREVLADLEAKA